VGFEAGIECDLGDGLIGVFQTAGRALETETADMLAEGLADKSAEDAMKVERGERGGGGHVLKAQIIVQMLLDIE